MKALQKATQPCPVRSMLGVSCQALGWAGGASTVPCTACAPFPGDAVNEMRDLSFSCSSRSARWHGHGHGRTDILSSLAQRQSKNQVVREGACANSIHPTGVPGGAGESGWGMGSSSGNALNSPALEFSSSRNTTHLWARKGHVRTCVLPHTGGVVAAGTVKEAQAG